MCLLRLHYAPLQRYMGYLCTRKAQYAPLRRNIHHGAQGRLYFLKNSGDPDDFLFWWFTENTHNMCLSGKCPCGSHWHTRHTRPSRCCLVHHQAAICTTKPQCAPWCTRETIFFEKFRSPKVLEAQLRWYHWDEPIVALWNSSRFFRKGPNTGRRAHFNVKLHFFPWTSLPPPDHQWSSPLSLSNNQQKIEETF